VPPRHVLQRSEDYGNLYTWLTEKAGKVSPRRDLPQCRVTGVTTSLLVHHLKELAKSGEDDGFVVVRRLLESGTPLIRAEVQWLTTPGTGDCIVMYEVADEVQAHLAALRVRTLNGNPRGRQHRYGHRKTSLSSPQSHLGDSAVGRGLSASSGANSAFVAAGVTAENVGGAAGVHPAHPGCIFIRDPATGALVVAPEHRGVVSKALRREARRFALELYVGQTGPQFAYLRFQFSLLRFKCRRAALLALRYGLGVAPKGILSLLSGKVTHG
jgi:hypothetical protein